MVPDDALRQILIVRIVLYRNGAHGFAALYQSDGSVFRNRCGWRWFGFRSNLVLHGGAGRGFGLNWIPDNGSLLRLQRLGVLCGEHAFEQADVFMFSDMLGTFHKELAVIGEKGIAFAKHHVSQQDRFVSGNGPCSVLLAIKKERSCTGSRDKVRRQFRVESNQIAGGFIRNPQNRPT